MVLAPDAAGAVHVRWLTEENGCAVVHGQEPLVSAWRRALSWLLGAMAPESLL